METWLIRAREVMEMLANATKRRHPGPWLKRRVGNGPTHYGSEAGGIRTLPSGARYQVRRDGWRRLPDEPKA